MSKRLERILNEKIRPALAGHGGNVRVVDYRDGVLRMELLGRCADCPASHLTAEYLISREVLAEFPEVKRVELVQSVSSDMLDLARSILSRRKETNGV